MKRMVVVVAALAAFGFVSSANAADMPTKAPMLAPAPVYNWTGFYLGVDVGAGSVRQNANTVDPVLNVTTNQAPDFVTLNSTNWMAGVYAGYNVQFNNVVAGVEADWSGSHFSASPVGPNNFNTTGLPVGSGSVTFSRTENWIASLRARLGYTVSPMVLLYITGGGAFTHIDYAGTNAFAGGCPNCGFMAIGSSVAGWTAGGGIEWAATPNWLLRAEYLHYAFNGTSTTVNFTGTTTPCCTYNFGRTNLDEGRVGIAYKF